MKISTSLFEKRSHPELNVKLSGWEQLQSYKDDPTVFISFTKIEKLGINPQTEYDTPAGVYFYPLKAAWEQYAMDSKKQIPLKEIFPFAADNPYIQIVKADTSKCLIVSKYTEADYQRDFDTLHKYFIPNDEAANEIAHKYGSFSPNRRIPPATRLIHQVLYFYHSAQREGALIVLGKQVFKKKSNFSTFCLKRILSYTGIVDDANEGAIHENEPIQAVLFDPRTYSLVKTIHNTPPKEYSSTEGQLIKFISQAVIDLGYLITSKSAFKNHLKYDPQVKRYASARITERVLDLVVAQLPGADKRVIGHLKKYADAAEGRTLAEFSLGWILPIIFEYADSRRSISNSIEFLNSFFEICTIRECTMPNKGLFKYNMLHLAARYKQVEILELAVQMPIAFGTPMLKSELFLDTDYDGSTPFQGLHYEDAAMADKFYKFLQNMRPIVFQEHPEAFEAH